MGTNGLRAQQRKYPFWVVVAILAMILGWLLTAVLLGRNTLLWLMTGLMLVGLVVAVVCLVRFQAFAQQFATGVYSRCLLIAARKIV